ncbi:CheR family methyltransferase [Marinobacterium rhizophilum]|uniref:Protein-glutamate O-methyltransferase CheR n=1 Tax=Marinobacterium rhizophilum TaxID=420402 RepID=A0ABY5HMB4_9GAMM|nr:protein-glutamate O-methyltransferase CheR [Marinobacterium rhizophilum]UTW13403.1 protein-glutamate O-methyltransferase CheR [Marinobacterium rhizophilum]
MELTDPDLDALLSAIYGRYGYDFRGYSRAHIKRRVLQRLRLSELDSIAFLQDKVLADSRFAACLLQDLSINVTEMFRDPAFYSAIREKVVPLLKTWSYVKIWHAGCSTGEEVYSMAILLKEEGLYDRVRIYATDFNQAVIDKAKAGIYPAERMRNYAWNYQRSGAKSNFSDYYHAQYDSAIMDPSLKKNIVWANHNLVTDSDFAETHMIVCRNVLIYFNTELQNKVHGVFSGSLVKGGVLCLGRKESIRFSNYSNSYSDLDRFQKIYRKNYRYG